ncbi:Copper chaperone [Handroanthus impetiginosus]|uniref:Copper chaperone n=1 Tax=Handroanthus impetiginosus TaxID=429701 RepID=A0A2G9IBS2_9LAMI|nr:Copper chaperone [Handroanthus impetiginosus]
MKKVVLKVDFADDKIKQKVMKMVFSLQGLESISFDQKDKMLTVTGHMNPEDLVAKVEKVCSTDIVSVGPAKEPKKEEPKKKETKNDEKKKGRAHKAYPGYTYHSQCDHQAYQQPPPPPYYQRTVEEDPNVCVIF